MSILAMGDELDSAWVQVDGDATVYDMQAGADSLFEDPGDPA